MIAEDFDDYEQEAYAKLAQQGNHDPDHYELQDMIDRLIDKASARVRMDHYDIDRSWHAF